MALVLGVIIGLIILFFLKNFALLGALIAGLVAGIVAKGPIAGTAAGFSVALLGFFLFSASSLAAGGFLSGFENGVNITGFAIQNVEPISFFKSIFGISGVAAATIAGLVGGFIRR